MCVCVFTCSPMDAVVDRRRQSDLKGESQSDGGEERLGDRQSHDITAASGAGTRGRNGTDRGDKTD